MVSQKNHALRINKNQKNEEEKEFKTEKEVKIWKEMESNENNNEEGGKAPDSCKKRIENDYVLNDELQKFVEGRRALENLYENYKEETGKKHIIGLKHTKGFENWLNKKTQLEDLEKYRELCSDFNKNCKKFLIFELKKSKDSGVSISEKLKISRDTVTKIAKKELTPDEYRKRFPLYGKHVEEKRKVRIEKKSQVEDLIRNSKLSRAKIAKKLEVSKSFVSLVGKEIYNPKQYERRFPKSKGLTPSEIRDIKALIDTTDQSEAEIAKNLKISVARVRRTCLKLLGKEEYRRRFKDTVNEFILYRVQDLILNSDLSHRKISSLLKKEYNYDIASTTIGSIAKKLMTLEEYEEKYSNRINEKTELKIRKYVLKTRKPKQMIAEKLEISTSPVEKIARELLNDKEYSERFPKQFPAEIGQIGHSILERLLDNHLRKMEIEVITEKLIEGKSPDHIIKVNKDFHIKLPNRVEREINLIKIDYSLDTSLKNFTKKCERKYQDIDSKFLFIPITFNENSIKKIKKHKFLPGTIVYQGNVIVLSLKEIPAFFNFDRETKENFIELAKLIIKCRNTQDEKILEFLKNLVKD